VNISLNFDLFVNEKTKELEILEAQIKDFARTFLPTQVNLNYRIIYFKSKILKIGLTTEQDLLELEDQISELLVSKKFKLDFSEAFNLELDNLKD